MLWQQKRGLFLVTLSGEESSSSSCSSMPWCMGVSCPSFLLPGGLLGKGVMWVAVLGLILSNVAGAGGGTEAHQVCVSPAPGCAKLCCSGSSSGSCPALGELWREAGDARWDTRSQDVAKHSTCPGALCGVPAWGS